MSHIIVTKTGNIMTVAYHDSADRITDLTRNMVTDLSVSKLSDDYGVETDILSMQKAQYTHAEFDTIDGTNITTNTILYNELVKLL